MCYCGYSTRRFITRKQGPNYEKPFWRCPLAREQQCKFFLWDDGAEDARVASYKQNPGPQPVPAPPPPIYTRAPSRTINLGTPPQIPAGHTPGKATVTGALDPCVHCKKATAVRCGTCVQTVCADCNVFSHSCVPTGPQSRTYLGTIPEVPSPFPQEGGSLDQPATSLFEETISKVATQAAQTVTERIINKLPGTFEQSSHSANRVRPPNKRETLLAAVKKDSRYAHYDSAQREQLWKNQST